MVGLRWRVLAPLIALAGGVFGTIAAIAEEANYGGYFGLFVAAPVVEEAIKPLGVYLLLAKWPHALRGRRYTAFLAALGGLAFALVENVLYLGVYLITEQSQAVIHDVMLWRCTVCLLMHAGCSFIVGFGINQKLLASVKGEIRFLKGNWKFFLIPMAIHGSYNGLAFLLQNQWGWWGG